MLNYMLLYADQKAENEVPFLLVFFVAVMLLCIFALFIFAIKTSLKRRRARKRYKEELLKKGVMIHTFAKHAYGLPFTRNSFCEIFTYLDRIEFQSGTTTITLARDKISDMSLKTHTEVQNHLVSSAGGAIAGAMAFGSTGALIGGRIRNIQTQTKTNYLLITYTDRQKRIAYICLNISRSPLNIFKLLKEFRELNTTSGIQIEL